MVNLTTADSALKTVYLDVVDNLLNVGTNPLLSKIKKTSKGVYGKEIKVLAPYGVNGGISTTSETGALPEVSNNTYVNLTSDLKNLYGRIEISDKAVRASQNSAGAFVNLLNDEMEGLVKASAFNLSRMLYGDGTGFLTEVTALSNSNKTITVESTKPFQIGMIIDMVNESTETVADAKLTVVGIDKVAKKITVNKAITTDITGGGFGLYVQNSYKNEITGVFALFNPSITTIYGLSKASYPFMQGSNKRINAALTEGAILTNIDNVEENGGSKINFISCASEVRRKYQELLVSTYRNINTIEVEGGFKGLDFYGIPMVSDRFIEDGEMYLFDTDDFTLHQMCDWEWMAGDDGSILSQKAGYPVYTATLVKYANLLCSRPAGQCRMYDIK